MLRFKRFFHRVPGLALVTGLLATAAAPAQALQVISFSPQGEVGEVRQAVATFDGAAVAFGDPAAASPLVPRCEGSDKVQGQGRWLSERRWAYDFAAPLPPGVRCSFSPEPGFRSTRSEALPADRVFRFSTGGPFVRSLQPYQGERIDEQQVFLLRLNGAATAESIAAHVWCKVEGIGERVPVRAIAGAQRDAVLKALGETKSAAAAPLAFPTLACNRTLPAAAHVELVFEPGVATPSGVASRVEKRWQFRVQQPFEAETACERENAQAACLPIRPLTLRFSAPVTRKQAAAVRLSGQQKTLEPKFDEAAGSDDSVVDSIRFTGPFEERGSYQLTLPSNFQDAAGRPLGNARAFPLTIPMGALPPLAKFAAAPFGIIERYAEPDSEKTGKAMLPVTLRHVEAGLSVKAVSPGRPSGQVSDLRPQTDADILAWLARVERYDESDVPREQAARDIQGPLPPKLRDHPDVESRSVSLLGGRSGVRTLTLPPTAEGDPRPFEVIGIPLDPGFHVVEIASPRLGEALLDPAYGAQRPMYVRTTALVTNLGVHFKLGRESALAWVTTLDKGRPVAGAAVRVSDCSGKEIASAKTDDAGIARFTGLSSEPARCGGFGAKAWEWRQAYFVSARAGDDLSFVWSDSNRGIESWRFNVPTSRAALPDLQAHTVFDRTLLRAGETVGMKHILRRQSADGFGLPAQLPQTLVITHEGSGQKFTQPLVWRSTATGGRSAENSFSLPKAAKLGSYSVALRYDRTAPSAGYTQNDPTRGLSLDTGGFRVEEFRLPVYEGRIAPAGKQPLVNLDSLAAQVQIGYVSGGPAANLPVRLSAMVRGKPLSFPDQDGFGFDAPRPRQDASRSSGPDDESGEETSQAADDARVVADKLPLVLDRQGIGKANIPGLPKGGPARELLMEARYADPNGEVQTLRSSVTLWPAAVIAGIKAEGWVSIGQKAKVQALALDLDGKPQADVPLSVRATARIVTTSRKRLVGGFYTYDNRTETKDLGEVCSGRSDARGQLACEASLPQAGEVELVASARDSAGNEARAATSVYVTRQGEIWFGGEDHDRIDVLPEKKSYQPGDTARFQVRMPFRQATALVAVEREGIVETQVVQLQGQDPTLTLKVKEAWGPNVYVSVLALRGRLREVPWYSFFSWGWRAPREWLTAYRFEGRDWVAPSALVDLSKPAYRFGMAEIRVSSKANTLDVQVAADKSSYPVRAKALVTITARLPDGKPAAGAEVALAAVDQALLELMPNDSWNILDAMLQRRAWGVATSTAQMDIVGRRHYGRKAVPAGGGGGHAATRELLDTLLLWNPRVVLDAQGRATVEVPLNDSLTRFRIVAVADSGIGLFGTGQTTIQATQDLQIVSGLPPLVREGDRFRAQLTLRNTTAKAMKVEARASAAPLDLPPLNVDIPPNEAREIAWDVLTPAMAEEGGGSLAWEISVRDTAGNTTARDALKLRQRVVPAVPLSVGQAALVQVDRSYRLDVAPPAGALPATGARRGGLKLALQSRLADGLPGVRDWFLNYPFACLEQKTSKAIGLSDAVRWRSLVAELPTYLDGDGLASYFPPREESGNHGSDTLTAYLLSASQQAAVAHPEFALPDDARDTMLGGLTAFVEGRIDRKFWSPRRDLDERKLAAIEALSRYGRAQGRMLGSIAIAPEQWPTHALIDWLGILQRVSDVPQRAERLAQAQQLLRSRLSYQGTRIGFSTERDDQWYWLMANADTNAARLLLAVMDDPAWKDDLPAMAAGLIARQTRGAWQTTTANLWGGLALERFSARFESTPVAGSTRATLGGASAAVDWSKVERVTSADAAGAANTPRATADALAGLRGNRMQLPWPADGAGTLELTQQGTGKPWLTVQAVAAVPRLQPFAAGYAVKKTITPVEQAVKGTWSRGDVMRITLEVDAATDMSWVVLSDPIPGGATILGSGLGRDSQIATQGEKAPAGAWPSYEERSFEAYRAYYQYLPRGGFKAEYTVRLNNVGEFSMPATRVEAMYAPEIFGEAPNARLAVVPAR